MVTNSLIFINEKEPKKSPFFLQWQYFLSSIKPVVTQPIVIAISALEKIDFSEN